MGSLVFIILVFGASADTYTKVILLPKLFTSRLSLWLTQSIFSDCTLNCSHCGCIFLSTLKCYIWGQPVSLHPISPWVIGFTQTLLCIDSLLLFPGLKPSGCSQKEFLYRLSSPVWICPLTVTLVCLGLWFFSGSLFYIFIGPLKRFGVCWFLNVQ